jgi:two-component system, response regulator / RNA-binding antiterminator
MTGIRHLRVLIANERQDHLERLAKVVSGLGHEVVAREITVEGVGPATARVRPDVALVGLGLSSKHALSLVSGIVREAFCPVIAVTPSHDPAWVDEAAKRGVYAYIIDGHPKELQSAIEITLRRFAEYQSLHGAFELRNAESLREREFARLRQRDALELHDSVVQGLAVAHLALQLDHKDESREALLTTLTQAKAIVARAVEELSATGIPKAQLIRDTAGRTADG